MPIIKVAQPSQTPRTTVLDFRKLFTTEERVAIEDAAVTSAEVRVYLADLSAVDVVSSEDPLTEAGLSKLEATGLIDAGRAEEILGQVNP